VLGSVDITNTVRAGQQGTAFDLSTQANADAIAEQLNLAFGVEDGSAVLNFQIGSVSTDAIGVQITDAGTKTLFGGNTLKLESVLDANEASAVLDSAIGRVTALRANIGALQSRFDFASANLETSIANVDAARSTFLDANISEESTNYAQAQVKLQASISILAQANQLPQNLLKLLQ
jgi:flagellin